MTIVSYARHGREFTIDTDDLDSLDYLLQYGMSQSCQDSIAGVGTKVWEELAEKAMKEIGLVPADKTKPFDEFRAFLKLPERKEFADTFAALVKSETVKTEVAQLEKRVNAILEGKVGSRSGSGDDAVDVEMRVIGRKMLRDWLAADGYKVPKDKDVYNETLKAYLAKHDAVVRPMAESNVKALAELKAKMAV